MGKKSFFLAAALISLCLLGLAARRRVRRDPAPAAILSQLRAQESPANSKVMWIEHELTDVYGPRLTGTPNLKAADDWAIRTMASFGMVNTHLEPYPFMPERLNHTVPGWDNLSLQADAVSPFHGQLIVKPLHWTPSTAGVVTAETVLVDPPGTQRFVRGGPLPSMLTQAQLDAFFQKTAPLIQNKIVLVGTPAMVPVNFNPPPLRRPDHFWNCQFNLAPGDPACQGFGRGGRGRGGRGPADPTRLTRQQVTTQLDAFLIKSGVKVRINDAGMAHGVIVAYNNPTYDITREVPTVVMRNDDYGRIARVLADGLHVTLRFNIVNTIYPAGATAYDAIGEIPGTDKKDEVIMLGGHLDSWNNATGATDNAIGCSMMMEAARILLAMHVHPRRTIRVALWSGEEEGLLGSLAYVDHHFGSFERPKPEYKDLVAYLNIDDGTSKPRGANVFGPTAAAEVIRQDLASFRDWGFMGTAATSIRRTGGTDSTSFNQAGLTGINFEQDPIEYQPFSWHTNLDTYERVVPEDAREGAAEIAAAVYALAMSDAPLPRFATAQMPTPPRPLDPSPQAALVAGAGSRR
ncbi:MAG TPA: M20/M25/M40 family metallo-hydrolase [Terriglobales bacterium]|nr:M20/M25/M40 family metallo-hydrolase [Terriglobales bacterium]